MTDNLIEALPFSIYWKDTSHRFLGCNARYLADIGLLDKKLLINRTSAQLPKHAKDIYCNMDVEKLIIQKKTPRLQLTRSIISSSQRTIYIKETLQIINDSEGKLSGILCCYEEICELEHKFMQDHRLTEYSPQSTNLDYVTSLASSVAHDFNNALAVISGYSQLLVRNSQLAIDKEKFTDYLSRISMATDKMIVLTDKLLHFSRAHIPQLERLELYNYIRKKLANYSSTIGVDINVTLDKSDKFWVMADVKQIDEVLLNLLSNAKAAIIDCTKATPIHINLSLVAIDTIKYVCLSITDSGIGMSKEIREKIFYPLYTTKPYIGAGFGLTNVLNIINQNNGYVIVNSDEGLGTVFKVHWPYAH